MREIKIIHIADVHWRGLSRHDEYRRSFSQFFKQASELSPDVIVLAGDIVHSKTQGISPELIDCLSWWFTNLSKICDVHVVLGNHDGILHNKSRQDAISPIINALNIPNIKLYKSSGTYKTGVDGFSWNVFSCFDEDGWPLIEPSSKDVNIAIFHGPVTGSSTDSDWLMDGEVDSGFFEKFDYALLGDIHKQQFLTQDKKIAYCGSTIQQNYGETVEKGFLFWKIRDKDDFDVSFHEIPSVKPFITVDWKGGVRNTLEESLKYPIGSRFRIRSSEGIPHVEIKQIQNELKEKMKASEVVFKIDTVSNSNHIDATGIKITKEDLRDPETQITLMKNYLDPNCLSSDGWKMLETMVREYVNQAKRLDTGARNVKWSIQKLQFDNLFSYGENNSIDFRKLSGITGIFAPNRRGKSSIVGAIMYCLFNSSDRGKIKNLYIMNTRKEYCHASMELLINGESHKVERQSTKHQTRKGQVHAVTGLNFHHLDSGGNEIKDLSGEQRTQTEKSLRQEIGSAEDFLLTSFASQGDMNRFIQEGSARRKRIISKFLDLDIFDQIYESVKTDSQFIKQQLSSAPDRDWDSLIEDIQNKISDTTTNMQEYENQVLEERTILQKLKSELSQYSDSDVVTLSDIENQKNLILDLNGKIINLGNQRQDIESSMEDSIIRIDRMENVIQSVPVEELKQKVDDLDQMEKDIRDLQYRLSSERDVLNFQQSSVKKLKEVPCGDSFPSCKFIKDSHLNKGKISKQKEVVSSMSKHLEISKRTHDCLLKENVKDKIEKYHALISKRSETKLEYSNLKVRYGEVDSEERNSERYKADLEEDLRCMEERVIDTPSSQIIDSLKRDILVASSNINSTDAKRISYAELRGSLNSDLEKTKEEKERYFHLREKWKVYEALLSSCSRKGIPSLIVKSQLPVINKEIENILSNVVNFTVSLDIDPDSDSIEIYIDYGDSKRIIELASGMEKMIGSLAIRVALTNISTLPKTDMLIIDEGFGTLDESNVESCNRLLGSLKRWFRNILVITHVDSIKDVADNTLEIRRIGKDSSVSF